MFGLNNMKYLLLSLASFALVSFAVAQTQTVGVFTNSENSFDGYTLYAPIPGMDGT